MITYLHKSSCLIGSIVVLFLYGGAILTYANFDDTDYQLAIDQKRYNDALAILNDKPAAKRTVPQKTLIQALNRVISVESIEWPKRSMATPEDQMDPMLLKKVRGYMNDAKKLFLADKLSSARYVLLQVLFVYPDYPKARYFLNVGYKMPPGTYAVKDQVTHLLRRSDNYFYGGNYLKAVQDLEVLAILESDNPVVYEKLGSAHYMMNNKNLAVDAWTTALFFNPDNTQLEALIASTKAILQDEARTGNPLANAKKAKVVIEDPQIMGVFKKQSDAFELVKQLRTRGLRVSVSENETDQWVVQVSRSELKDTQKPKGSE
ncbi:MAG: tetratricopeptide repeat protein [Candidatus Marinamargulisbacteria bacterium]